MLGTLKNDVFSEQLKLSIIKEAPEDCKAGESHREDKNTSKIRIVFDASTRSEGLSLNDPQMILLIFDILHRFRTYPIALISSIKKAFL